MSECQVSLHHVVNYANTWFALNSTVSSESVVYLALVLNDFKKRSRGGIDVRNAGVTGSTPRPENVQDMIGLYMSTPDRAIVLCVNEKSQIQILDLR